MDEDEQVPIGVMMWLEHLETQGSRLRVVAHLHYPPGVSIMKDVVGELDGSTNPNAHVSDGGRKPGHSMETTGRTCKHVGQTSGGFSLVSQLRTGIFFWSHHHMDVSF